MPSGKLKKKQKHFCEISAVANFRIFFYVKTVPHIYG